MQSKSIVSLSTQVRSTCRHVYTKHGHFYRPSDKMIVKRFRCKLCGLTKSEATDDLRFHQRKRQLNSTIFRNLVSCVSQRRCAFILGINRKTVVRKFRFLGTQSIEWLKHYRQSLADSIQQVEFDDLETFEHSKCKPLSVPLAVEYRTRRVLDFKVASIPAKGLLAAISRKKYGRRKDQRAQKYNELFMNLKECVKENAHFKSDQNSHYPKHIRTHFPKATHKAYKGRSGCVTGQGELKSGGFDPLFSLNHTFAKLRADINRLVRRTWCTTKKPDQLELHIAMMVVFHNYNLKIKSTHKLRTPEFTRRITI